MPSENENIFKLVNNFYRGKVVKSNTNKTTAFALKNHIVIYDI